MSRAADDAVFLHCLPRHKEEVNDQVTQCGTLHDRLQGKTWRIGLSINRSLCFDKQCAGHHVALLASIASCIAVIVLVKSEHADFSVSSLQVFYSRRSLVFPEAENRMWTVMALMQSILGK